MFYILLALLFHADDKPDGWVVVSIANKGFAITMPKPERKTFQEQGPDRKLVHHSAYLAKAGELAYAVHVYEYSTSFMEQPAKALLDHARTQALHELNGRLVSEKDIRYEQVPGREVLIDGRKQGFRLTRFYVFNLKLYAVSITAPREADFTSEGAVYYYQSFKLRPVKPGNVK
jgi:hypothetical protein